MDNASIHHSCIDSIRAIASARNIKVIFLPPYSPDFNPIEESFSVVKGFIRRHYRRYRRRFSNYQDFLAWSVRTVGSGVKAAQNARGRFRHAGIRGVAAERA